MRKNRNARRAKRARAPTATPTPTPALAPVLRPLWLAETAAVADVVGLAIRYVPWDLEVEVCWMERKSMSAERGGRLWETLFVLVPGTYCFAG